MAGRQPNRAQNCPKMSLKSTLKLTPEDQNDAPKRYWVSGTILASIWSRLGVPKGFPKGTQNRSKIALRAPGPPKGLQGPPRRPPGSHFGLILGPRELIFEPFKRPFSKLARAHHTIENTVRNHFPKDPLRPLRDRCAQHRRLSGRFGAAGPLEIRPLSRSGSTEAVERSEESIVRNRF